jgi:hypothetical protein
LNQDLLTTNFCTAQLSGAAGGSSFNAGYGNFFFLSYVSDALVKRAASRPALCKLDTSAPPADPYVVYTQNGIVYRDGSVRVIPELSTEHNEHTPHSRTEHYIPAGGCYHYALLTRVEEHIMCNPLLESRRGPKKDGSDAPEYEAIFVMSQMMGERTFHLLSEVRHLQQTYTIDFMICRCYLEWHSTFLTFSAVKISTQR